MRAVAIMKTVELTSHSESEIKYMTIQSLFVYHSGPSSKDRDQQAHQVQQSYVYYNSGSECKGQDMVRLLSR